VTRKRRGAARHAYPGIEADPGVYAGTVRLEPATRAAAVKYIRAHLDEPDARLIEAALGLAPT
jgi:hypothetical protein